MTIIGLCFDANVNGAQTHHDLVLVLISFIVALVASFTALDMTERQLGMLALFHKLSPEAEGDSPSE